MNPIEQIEASRVEARKIQDTNADICFLAIASPDGQASVRTLVLRDITENRFSLFMNQTSPKWQLLSNAADYELLLWHPTQQKQFRIKGTYQTIDIELIKTNWHRRPQGSKYLDYVYKEMAPQSSVISSRQALVDKIDSLKANYNVDSLTAPPQVAGIELVATRIDMLDLNREDRIHDRQLFTLTDGRWRSQVLVP